MIDPEKEAETLKTFRRSRIMTASQLADHLVCSIPTVRNRLKSWETLTSYNRNGRYYALADVAKFDENGLWKHKGVFFSNHGTLKATVRHLVGNSPAGLDAREIGRLVGLPARSFMAQLQKIPGLRREKHEKRFVYYSDEEDTYRSQEARRVEESKRKVKELPSDTEAIFILVDRIKHPDSSFEQCAQRLRRRGRRVDISAVRNLLADHGIEKKTQDTSSSGR
jgi:hypothetical protein